MKHTYMQVGALRAAQLSTEHAGISQDWRSATLRNRHWPGSPWQAIAMAFQAAPPAAGR